MNYKQKYLKHFGYGEQDFVPCEICGKTANGGVHHIKSKGRGGSDNIENLAGLCIGCHNDCHNEILSERDMLYIHKRFMVATTGPMGKKL